MENFKIFLKAKLVCLYLCGLEQFFFFFEVGPCPSIFLALCFCFLCSCFFLDTSFWKSTFDQRPAVPSSPNVKKLKIFLSEASKSYLLVSQPGSLGLQMCSCVWQDDLSPGKLLLHLNWEFQSISGVHPKNKNAQVDLINILLRFFPKVIIWHKSHNQMLN